MKKILIFGCGYHGRAVFRNLNQKDIFGWLDNNPNLQKKKKFNKKILSPKNLKNYNYTDIIVAGRNNNSIIKQLKELKVKKKNINIWDSTKLIQKKNKIKKRSLKYIKIFKYLINILNTNKINYWIDRSGLLSLLRDKHLGMLSDMDISINEKDKKKLFRVIKSNKDFTVKKSKDKQYKIYIQSINSSLDYEPAIIDFIFLKFNKKTVHHFYNKFKKSRIEFFIKKKIIKHSNIEFKIPSNTNKYLSSIYGKKWKSRPKFWVNKLALKNIQNKLK